MRRDGLDRKPRWRLISLWVALVVCVAALIAVLVVNILRTIDDYHDLTTGKPSAGAASGPATPAQKG